MSVKKVRKRGRKKTDTAKSAKRRVMFSTIFVVTVIAAFWVVTLKYYKVFVKTPDLPVVTQKENKEKQNQVSENIDIHLPSNEDNKVDESEDIEKDSKPKIVKEEKPVTKPKMTNKTNIKDNFQLSISKYCEKYIGLPYQYGADPEKDNATDNSHLFYTILCKAAENSGIKYLGDYCPISDMKKNMVEVFLSELQNGDFIFLKNGHAGMVYGMENKDYFYLIYASESKQEVVSVESSELRNYWMKNENKLGYFRLKPELFVKQ